MRAKGAFAALAGAGVLLALTVGSARAGTTFTVLDTNDSGPGSLRQAILDANASPGKDTIAFDILGSGVQVIQPSVIGADPQAKADDLAAQPW
jgi:hypothetical protein